MLDELIWANLEKNYKNVRQFQAFSKFHFQNPVMKNELLSTCYPRKCTHMQYSQLSDTFKNFDTAVKHFSWRCQQAEQEIVPSLYFRFT